MVQRQDRKDGLDGTGSAQHVAGHRFRGADGDGGGVRFKDGLDGHGFRGITG